MSCVDGNVVVVDAAVSVMQTARISSAVRSVYVNGNDVLVGTQDGQIVVVRLSQY